jgi:hypothetical protein
MDRLSIELALDNGMLWVRMANGRWWKARRNGRTQIWKTQPDNYSVPIKAGMTTYARIDHSSDVGEGLCEDSKFWPDYVIMNHNPNTKEGRELQRRENFGAGNI